MTTFLVKELENVDLNWEDVSSSMNDISPLHLLNNFLEQYGVEPT